MDPALLITAFVTLFVVIDPIGMAPLFVALTQGMSARKRRTIALRAAVTAIALLTVFGLFGEKILSFIGISMPAFRIAGGVLLFLTALDMLFERRTKRRQDKTHEDDDPGDDPSIFPLAVPLTAGPGAMATMILLAGQTGASWSWVVAVHLVMIAVVAICLLLWLAAGLMERALGPTGINVVTRLLGMLLAALSVQFVIDGLRNIGALG